MDKRGLGFSAPLIVIIIGALMLAYLYFLPVNDKCNLIPGLAVCGEGPAPSIISVSPGPLSPENVSQRYSIPNVELFRLDNLDISTLFSDIEVKRGWFFAQPVDVDFSAPVGARDTELFFILNHASGVNVVVNGNNIARISGDGVQQVRIPPTILQEDNHLRLTADTPLMPWSKNSASISKVILRVSYTKTMNKYSYNVSIQQDVNSLQQGILDFNSDCFSDDNLTVTLNGNQLINGKVCKGFRLDVKKYLKANNTIDFMTDGNYLIRDAYIDASMNEKVWPTYYFDMPASRLENKKPVMLTLDFNETGNKALSVYINGVSISAQTSKLTWQTTINKFLNAGQNSIMFVPETEVTVTSAEVQ